MNSEVSWVLISSGTQVHPQIILDPDYLLDDLSVSYNCDFSKYYQNDKMTWVGSLYFALLDYVSKKLRQIYSEIDRPGLVEFNLPLSRKKKSKKILFLPARRIKFIAYLHKTYIFT